MSINEYEIEAERQRIRREVEKRQEDQMKDARRVVIELLARNEVMRAVKVACKNYLFDEIDDKYLKKYADTLIRNGNAHSSEYRRANKIYEKLGDQEKALLAKGLADEAYKWEYNSDCLRAMTT